MTTKAPTHSHRSRHLLIVDDDPGQRSLLTLFLEGQGFSVLSAGSGEEALDLAARPGVAMMISDVRMPGISGLETLRRLRAAKNAIPVLLVTAYADIRDAVGAVKDGAVDYLAKPIDLDELHRIVLRALGSPASPASKPSQDFDLPPSVIARSPLTLEAFREAALVAPSETRVLITGESGTGKEVVADMIHAWSPRARGPIVKVNCAAIPENLLESELFGHEKGAFTGAHQSRAGRFEEADTGTIFLDEIGEMPPSLQAKLLRITQDGSFRRLGASRETRTRARLLAATNRDLEALIEAGSFREDLFYRLNVVEINLPPLRERTEDLLPLATAFLTQFLEDKPRLSDAVVEVLLHYPWPGNIRELRNAMERAALVARGEIILPEHLPTRIRATPPPPPAAAPPHLGADLEAIEREAILAALRNCNFNRSEAARALNISRRSILYKIQSLREKGYVVDR